MADVTRISCDTITVTGDDFNFQFNPVDGVTLTIPMRFSKSKMSKNGEEEMPGEELNLPHGIDFKLLSSQENFEKMKLVRNSRKGAKFSIATKNLGEAQIYHFKGCLMREDVSIGSRDEGEFEAKFEGYPRIKSK